jgi:hypothetical protein
MADEPVQAAPAHRPSLVESTAVDLQVYFSILKEVQEQIRASDRKAGFFTAANALLVGFLARELEQRATGIGGWAIVLAGAVAGVGALLSVSLVTWAFTIGFGKLASLSRVYFGRISQDYWADPAKYVSDTCRMREEEWAGDLAAFIVEASMVASRKERLLTAAAWATLVGFCAWTLVAVAFCFASGSR